MNRTKKLCLFGVFTAVCMVFGYIESLFPLCFIAPGVKLGLANSVALLLVSRGEIRGAFAVNITRILLSSLLFGSAMSLAFSLSGGVASLAVMSLFSRSKGVSVIGFSILGGAVHNVFQLLAALVTVGLGAVYYLPVLIASGAISGALIGVLCSLLSERASLFKEF